MRSSSFAAPDVKGRLLCRCNGVSESDVTRHVRSGKSLSQLVEQTGATTNCGTCANDLVNAYYAVCAEEEARRSGQLNLWAHLDLNQGPRDYESPALTD